MKDYILDIVHLNNDFTGTGMYMALYFFTLLFIAFYLKDKRLKNAVLHPSLLLLLGIYICLPAVNRFLFTLYDDEVRGRYIWILMAPAIAALGCTLMVDMLRERKQQILLTIALVPVIFACGVFQITDYRFQRAENLYKLPQVLIDISDTVLSEQREADSSTARIIVPYETAYAFRQYSTGVELLYGEDATYGRIWDLEETPYVDKKDVCNTMQTTCPDLELIAPIAEKYEMEYIMFDCAYVDFGLESINHDGYTEDENFVGDRTPDADSVRRMSAAVGIDNDHWDLKSFGLEYFGTYGRYLLYRYIRK